MSKDGEPLTLFKRTLRVGPMRSLPICLIHIAPSPRAHFAIAARILKNNFPKKPETKKEKLAWKVYMKSGFKIYMFKQVFSLGRRRARPSPSPLDTMEPAMCAYGFETSQTHLRPRSRECWEFFSGGEASSVSSPAIAFRTTVKGSMRCPTE